MIVVEQAAFDLELALESVQNAQGRLQAHAGYEDVAESLENVAEEIEEQLNSLLRAD